MYIYILCWKIFHICCFWPSRSFWVMELLPGGNKLPVMRLNTSEHLSSLRRMPLALRIWPNTNHSFDCVLATVLLPRTLGQNIRIKATTLNSVYIESPIASPIWGVDSLAIWFASDQRNFSISIFLPLLFILFIYFFFFC